MGDSISSYWNRNDTGGEPKKVRRLKDINDPIVENVKNLLTVRSKVGIAKYDTTLHEKRDKGATDLLRGFIQKNREIRRKQ